MSMLIKPNLVDMVFFLCPNSQVHKHSMPTLNINKSKVEPAKQKNLLPVVNSNPENGPDLDDSRSI